MFPGPSTTSTLGPMVTIKSDLHDIKPDKETNICPDNVPDTDPAGAEGPEDIDLDSLPSSQNTIADEEESREYIEFENDEKCDNCKLHALKLEKSEIKVDHLEKSLKYLKKQRNVEKKLREEEVKKRKQETICRTEEITTLSKKATKLEEDLAESERKRLKLDHDLNELNNDFFKIQDELMEKEANMKEMQRRIETLQREKENNRGEFRKLEKKNRTLEEEKRKVGVVLGFIEKNKDSSKNIEDEENVRVNSNGVLTLKNEKNIEDLKHLTLRDAFTRKKLHI